MAAVADAVAEFVAGIRYEDLDPRAVTMVTDAITDAVGTGLAGSQEEIARILLAATPTRTGAGQPDRSGTLLLGTGRRAELLDAALFNGTVIHALDYDDTAHPAYSHPSSHLVPVLLGLGDPGVDPRDLIAAYAAGFEVEARLGRSLNLGHYLRGWHATGTFGPIAAAAAACRLLGLPPDRVGTALAIAASTAAGLRANFGTMVKPLHAGLAAQNGLRAATLAARGFTASAGGFDGRFGFLDVYRDGDRDDAPWHDLGQRWEIRSAHGLALKPYPSCGATHPAIEAALALRADLAGDGIASVRVGVNAFTQDILIYPDPGTPLQAKFSMPYCVAAALAAGEVTLSTFTPQRIHDPAVRALLPKIRVEVDQRVRDHAEFGTFVTVQTSTGRQLSRSVMLANGKPARWLGTGALRDKFVDCAGPVLGADRARSAFTHLQSLPTPEASLAGIVDSLEQPPTGTTREV